MTALLPSEIPMNRLTISGLFAPQPPSQFFSNFFLHSVYRREGSIANTHAEWVIMVWRKAAVSARKAEDHAERRRPVNQPRGLNRRESAPFDSARRCGLLLPKSCPLARNAVVENEDLLDIPLIRHRRIGFQQEIAHWTQTEIERLHVAATYNVLVGAPSAVVQSGLGYLLITDDHLPKPRTRSSASARSPLTRKFAAPLSRNATPSLPKPPMPFSKPPSPSTNQAECPLIPLYKGITGLPQQTEECCPRLPCVRGAGRRSGLRGCLPFLLLFPSLSISFFSPKAQRKACRFTRQAFHGIRR